MDVARTSVPWVRAALDALAPTAGHWTVVSSGSVYADHALLGRSAAAPTLAVVRTGRPTIRMRTAQ